MMTVLRCWANGALPWMVAVGLLVAAAAGHAEEVAVDLELVLAVDISGSIDAEEARLQREGYMAALVNPRVITAIRNGAHARIAVTYIEWAHYHHQRVVVPWRVIEDEASAKAFVGALAANPPVTGPRTSISGAIDYGARQFDGNGYQGLRKVIDISGDGRNNNGRPAAEARDEAVRMRITINGLPIMNDRSNFGMPPDPGLEAYFREQVIGGPGHFVVVAENFATFGQAILNKLVLEIAGTALPDGMAAAPAP